MIFLTDGTPTAGERVPEKILEALPKLNTSGTRVFVLGVGHDVNAHLLDRLAELTDGSSEYVDPKEEIDVKVAALYNRLSHPVLTDVKLAFGDLPTYAIYPQKIPALFKGSEVMIAGRYRGGGKHTVALSGTLHGEPRRYACTVELPETGKRGPGFVASLWAARKIGYLLQEIRLHGESPELVEEVIRLSRQFGIVTEYTVFLAMAEADMSDEEVAAEALERMRKANEQQAGQWAVNQAMNDRALQNRVVAGAAANVYRDRRGRVQAAEGVRLVGRRAFYLRDGRWVDAEDAGDRKVRKVKLFSKEYFELLRSNREFAAAQAIGENVTMNVGEERIAVEK
jgi:Ca-activated chloride channel family protein